MKIAKKVLAVVMAIAMIGCISAMAFAEAKPVYSIEVEDVADGVVTVKLFANNMVGLKSGAIEFKYDTNVLAFDYDDDGADAAMANLTKKNSFTKELNENVKLADGSTAFKFGFYFKEILWTAADFAANAKKPGTVNINSDKFELGVLYFNVKDNAAKETNFVIVAEDTVADGVEAATPADVKVVLKAEEQTTAEVQTTAYVEEKTTAAEPGTTKEANPNTGDNVNTGDNMALAAAFGVVALAGAAFVISKKRK